MPITAKQRKVHGKKGGADRLFIVSNAPSRLSKVFRSSAGVLVEQLADEAQNLLKQAFGKTALR